EALKIVFKTTTAATAADATDGVDEDYGTFLAWVRENVPREYTKTGDLARAYNQVSEADVFRGRMEGRQDWSLLKYVYELATVGVALSKEEKYSGWTKYSYPSSIRKMGKSRAARNRREGIGKKVGEQMHVSISKASDLIPFLQLLFQDEEGKDDLVQQFGLDEKEVEYIEEF
ncbi:MAG: replication factor C large subunit, partial [Candidatus Nanohaloarchaea archaeon]|nr:replication factor C large subunit [Candidatus Nanohaloarchaea archaeon]